MFVYTKSRRFVTDNSSMSDSGSSSTETASDVADMCVQQPRVQYRDRFSSHQSNLAGIQYHWFGTEAVPSGLRSLAVKIDCCILCIPNLRWAVYGDHIIE